MKTYFVEKVEVVEASVVQILAYWHRHGSTPIIIQFITIGALTGLIDDGDRDCPPPLNSNTCVGGNRV